MLNLSSREKKLLSVLIIFLSLTMGYFFIYIPVSSIIESGKLEYKQNQNSLSKLDTIYNNYKNTKSKRSKLSSMLKIKGGELVLIDELAKKYNILENKSSGNTTSSTVRNKYSKIKITLKFEGVAINPLLKFIQEIENSNRIIKVSRFRLSSAVKGRNNFDSWITLESYSLK